MLWACQSFLKQYFAQCIASFVCVWNISSTDYVKKQVRVFWNHSVTPCSHFAIMSLRLFFFFVSVLKVLLQYFFHDCNIWIGNVTVTQGYIFDADLKWRVWEHFTRNISGRVLLCEVGLENADFSLIEEVWQITVLVFL